MRRQLNVRTNHYQMPRPHNPKVAWPNPTPAPGSQLSPRNRPDPAPPKPSGYELGVLNIRPLSLQVLASDD